MRLMAHDSCRPGDVVADSVRGPQGEVLIEKGTALTPLLLEQCAALRTDILPIEWLGWDSIRPSWWVSEGIMERCRAWVSPGLAGLDADGLITARRVTAELLAILPPEDQRPFEAMPRYQVGSPAAAAWINTVGLTIKLAAGLDWKRVEDYALAAVILGLEFGIPAGRVQIPESCRLDPVITAIRTRSAVPATTRAVIAQHHARWDGSGDPPLRGDQIFLGAQIVGLAEAVNTLVLAPDDEPLLVHEALEWASGGAGIDFAIDWVRRLQRILAPYPVGSTVQLGNNEVAVVLDNALDWPARPVVRLFNGPYAGQTIRLTDPDHRARGITGFYTGREIPS